MARRTHAEQCLILGRNERKLKCRIHFHSKLMELLCRTSNVSIWHLKTTFTFSFFFYLYILVAGYVIFDWKLWTNVGKPFDCDKPFQMVIKVEKRRIEGTREDVLGKVNMCHSSTATEHRVHGWKIVYQIEFDGTLERFLDGALIAENASVQFVVGVGFVCRQRKKALLVHSSAQSPFQFSIFVHI